MANRNWYRHTMREGNRIIKYGITTDPERRETQNVTDGLGDHMRIEGPRVTEETARSWEQQKVEAYRERTGHNPPGNKP